MPATSVVGRAREALLRMLVRRVFSRALPALNAARTAYGLPSVAHVYDQLLRADEILVLTSPVFDFTSLHMPRHVRYAGPELGDPEWAEPWQTPFAADDSRPLVLVGLSSTFQNAEVPAGRNVVVVRSAPHAQILEHTSLLITHGGHGTTLKGLAAGVPLVCVPMGRDQHDAAARVVHHGAGVRLDVGASPAQIAAAVERVLATPSYKDAARRLQRAIAAKEGCVDVVARLERLACRNPAGATADAAPTAARG